MVEDTFLPWQEKQRDQVLAQKNAERLPHALLLAGPEHIGKYRFARALAGLLLCRQPGEEGRCGQCATCGFFSAGTHPDFRLVQPEESKLIRIEQIRDLIDWASQTSQMGGFKVAVILPAGQMNVSSANALLKCLEEPAPNTLLILVTSQPGRLLPTVRSRCQRLDFPIPPPDEALRWLAGKISSDNDAALLLGMAGGAPLAVVYQMSEEYLKQRATLMSDMRAMLAGQRSAVDVAGTLAGLDPGMTMQMLQDLFSDVLKIQMTGEEKFIKNKDMSADVREASARMDRRAVLDLIERISAARRAVQGPSNPNLRLLLEDVLIEVVRGFGL